VIFDPFHLGHVMFALERIRKEQAEIEINFTPVFDMYNLLDTYLAGGITDKDEMEQRSLLSTNWTNLITTAEQKGNEM
jgi:dynein heavy chain